MSYEKLVHRILRRFKCHLCGLCCNVPPMLTVEDMKRLASHLNLTFDTFIQVYTVIPTEGKPYLMNPCPFLSGNICTVHSIRPKVCRFFPFQVDVPLVFGLDWCPLAQDIARAIFKKFPYPAETQELPDFMKFRKQIVDVVSPEVKTEFLKSETRCLALPNKELRWLARKRRKRVS